MHRHDDTLLLEWERRRDPEAFRALVVRYSGMVHAVCRRTLGDAAEAEDVTQECFEALASARRLPRGYLAPWLHRVASNLARRRLRDARRRRARETHYAEAMEGVSTPDWEEVYPHVDAALNRLPESLRVPVAAHYLEGATQRGIAERLGIAESTVRYRIGRALERLGRDLRRQGVTLGTAALATALEEGLAQTIPVSPQAVERLGRLALAQAGRRVGWGALLAKGMAGVAAIAVVAAGFVFWQGRRGGEAPGEADAAATVEPRADATRSSALPDTAPVAASAFGADPPPAAEGPAAEPKAASAASAALVPLSEGIPEDFAYLFRPIDPGEASIRGVVRRGDGTPAAGARVTLFRSDSWWKHGYAETTADGEGRYALEGLSEGGYVLTAALDGEMVAVHTGLYPVSLIRDRMTELNSGHMLPPSLNGLNWLHEERELDLEPINGAFSGRVVDPDGLPVAGALVVTPGRPGLMQSLTVNARTDGEGRFRLPYPTAKDSTYTLVAYAAGYAPSEVKDVAPWSSDNEIVLVPPSHIAGVARWVGTGAPVAGAEVMLRAVHEHDPFMNAVTDGEGRFLFPCLVAKKYQLMLSEPEQNRASVEAPVLHLGETGSLDDYELPVWEGTVIAGRAYVKETDEPLPGLRITIPNTRTSDTFRAVKTGADGRYALVALPAGKYAVRCSPAENVVRNFYYADQGPAGPVQQVELAAGEARAEVDFVFEAGATVSGRVTDTEGNPVAGAMLTARNDRRGEGQSPDDLPLITSAVPTDSDGYYRLRGFQPSEQYQYSMSVSSRRHGFLRSDPFRVSGDMTRDFMLEAAAPVSGIVTDLAGRPLPLVGLSLESVPGVDPRPKARPQGALSGADGRFRFSEGAFPGTYTVGVSGWINQDLGIPWQNARARTPHLVIADTAPVTDLRVVIPVRGDCGELSGRVYEENTSRALAGARVEVSRLEVAGEPMGLFGGEFQAGAEPGSFTLGYVYPGTVTLSAEAEGFPKQEVLTLEVTPGMKRQDLRLFLRGQAALRSVIEGTVTAEGGDHPPRQTLLWLYSDDVQLSNSQFGVDEHGDFRIEDLEPGHYQLVAASRDWTDDESIRWYRLGAADIAAEPGMAYTCDFELGGTGALTGVIDAPPGASDVDLRLRAADAPGAFPDHGTDRERYNRQVVAYANHPSPDGEYIIRRLPPGRYEAAATCVLHRGTEDEAPLIATHEVTVPPGGEAVLDLVIEAPHPSP